MAHLLKILEARLGPYNGIPRPPIEQPQQQAALAAAAAAAAAVTVPAKKSRSRAITSRWAAYEATIDNHLSRARSARFLLETYGTSAGDKRVKPMGELALARQKLVVAREGIRAVLREVATLYPATRWDGATTEIGVYVEQVACAVCGGLDACEANDIVLCDRAGCFRAFHMQCADPVLDKAKLGGPEDDWFCHQCSCLDRCISKLNEEYEREEDDEWTCEKWADVLADEYEDEAVEEKAEPTNSILAFDETNYDEAADSDFQSEASETDEPPMNEPPMNGAEPLDAAAAAAAWRANAGGGPTDATAAYAAAAALGAEYLGAAALGAAALGASAEPAGEMVPTGEAAADGDVASSSDGDDSSGDNDEDEAPIDAEELAALGGAEPAPHVDDLSESNIIEGPRKRARVDYTALDKALFGDVQEDVDGDAEFTAAEI
ncbi:hypothetical protein M885DRAFT_562089 [Pelagophyceae sp. CCMP2097]|nr:hypothetical protein M885DRAFT_562089 [Pelagophyceae sp. CCMP2097]|mmetsp:Transcript_18458/g.63669  ORF Transcript_18458/g.63669 Transcript_18458/m.63669 type:complete len:435 (+) Transcript_18458:43-1347(+)